MEIDEESLIPSFILADEDTSEPPKNTASVADQKSTYTASAEDCEEQAHSKQQTNAAPSEVDGTVR